MFKIAEPIRSLLNLCVTEISLKMKPNPSSAILSTHHFSFLVLWTIIKIHKNIDVLSCHVIIGYITVRYRSVVFHTTYEACN